MTVKVTNDNEVGVVSFDQVQPQVGVAVTAMLDDSDMGVTGTTWQWASTDGPNCTNATFQDDDDIMGAKSATYTPESDDADMCLQATATYRDNASEKDDTETEDVDESLNTADETITLAVEAKTTGNAAPNFTEEDMDEDDVKETGEAGAPFMRSIKENTDADMPIGNPVPGADKDNDELIYTLGGADAASFSITASDSGAGQIKTKADLDYETQSSYMLEVTATDPSLASMMAMVMITVEDENEPAMITGDDPEDFPENSDGDVATFMATDEDSQDNADNWGLEGTDAGSFDITGGVLTFKSMPNFEEQSSYAVTVTVTDRDVKATKDVTVKITNGEEDGSVKLSQIQPQVEIKVTASVSDPDNPDNDVSGTMWQWAKSMDMTTWTDIDKATTMDYTPVVGDEGYYLRATATYTDTLGDDKTAMMVSERAVEEKTAANAVPDFGKEDFDDNDTDETGEPEDTSTSPTTPAAPFLRNVDENTASDMNIGNPIAATDVDVDDLLYKLTDTDDGIDGDSAKFTIDERTGQIKTKAPLDFEVASGDDNADENNDDTYEVKVTATDPSLAAKTALVNIRVQDLNEAPDFGDDDSKAVRADENGTNIVVDDDTGGSVSTYDADDEDAGDTVVITLGGDDAKLFTIDGGTLAFVTGENAHTPNFEDKSSYSIVVKATDMNADDEDHVALTTELAVTVRVVNLDEEGSVSFSQVQPQEGVPITAMLTDPDGSVTGTMWQWSSQSGTANAECDNSGNFDDIEGATAATYTPTAAGLCLRATAYYNDAVANTTEDNDQTDIDESLDTANDAADMGVEPKTTGNAAPKFGEEDLDEDGVMEKGTADAPFVRSVDENTEAPMDIGDPVEASDTDLDELIYKLGGANAMYFDIDAETGQIMVGDGTMLDFEMRESYMVEVTAYDPSLASATAMVMIMVLDEDEDATLELVGMLRVRGDSSVSYAEDRDDPVASYEAFGPGSQTVDWSLGGDDAGVFDISADGELSFSSSPDYDAPADADEDNDYEVTVMAAGDDDMSATYDVTVTVTGVNEAPMFAEDPAMREVAENSAAGENVGDPVTATDPEDDTLTYALGGDDAASFAIDPATGQISVGEGTELDFESEMTTYTVTVTATDGEGLYDMVTVTINVTDVNDQMPMFADDTAEFSVAENSAGRHGCRYGHGHRRRRRPDVLGRLDVLRRRLRDRPDNGR